MLTTVMDLLNFLKLIMRYEYLINYYLLNTYI